jgi:hypothetical protein
VRTYSGASRTFSRTGSLQFALGAGAKAHSGKREKDFDAWERLILSQRGVAWDAGNHAPRLQNRVIDGHLRQNTMGDTPVLVLDVTEQEADKLLATLDPLAGMAIRKDEKMKALLNGISTSNSAVGNILSSLGKVKMPSSAPLFRLDLPSREMMLASGHDPDVGGRIETDGAAPDLRSEGQEQTGIYAFREDVIFSSSNRWGIPDLLPDLLSDQVPDHTWAGPAEVISDPTKLLFLYAENRMEPAQVKGGVLGFYTYDRKFEIVWNDAVRILERFKVYQWGATIEPDFSTWGDDPLIVRMWNEYRSRWCARCWPGSRIQNHPRHALRKRA